MASREESAALVTGVQWRVHGGLLARACERQVDEEEEGGFEGEVPVQPARKAKAVKREGETVGDTNGGEGAEAEDDGRDEPEIGC